MQAFHEAWLADTFRDVHPDATAVGTLHAFRGGSCSEKIDYVLCAAGLVTDAAAILGENGPNGRFVSDHHPVRATVRLR